ncbi:hypothetical protein VE02_06491 [Pseudogymnoascus sp. 03VT05]|nr:hypothetical protein VE02_06491 [Pseudogymnoascus sp. 03VT05]
MEKAGAITSWGGLDAENVTTLHALLRDLKGALEDLETKKRKAQREAAKKKVDSITDDISAYINECSHNYQPCQKPVQGLSQELRVDCRNLHTDLMEAVGKDRGKALNESRVLGILQGFTDAYTTQEDDEDRDDPAAYQEPSMVYDNQAKAIASDTCMLMSPPLYWDDIFDKMEATAGRKSSVAREGGVGDEDYEEDQEDEEGGDDAKDKDYKDDEDDEDEDDDGNYEMSEEEDEI